jgi:hypothetical protein
VSKPKYYVKASLGATTSHVMLGKRKTFGVYPAVKDNLLFRSGSCKLHTPQALWHNCTTVPPTGAMWCSAPEECSPAAKNHRTTAAVSERCGSVMVNHKVTWLARLTATQ